MSLKLFSPDATFFHLKCTKFNFGWSSVLGPTGEFNATILIAGYGEKGRKRKKGGRREWKREKREGDGLKERELRRR